jgi:hypothetical protein
MATQTQDVARWTKTERAELRATPFDRDVMRALVDHRFTAQERRKATGNQIGAIERSTDTSVDPMAIRVAKADFALIEAKMDAAIKGMVESHRAGRWAVSIPGIAHTFAGVLLAYVELHPWVCIGQRNDGHRVKCTEESPCSADCHRGYVNTAGKLWRFAGLDPTCTWAKGQRRPYCAQLKTLAWQIGESFKKLGAESTCLYARLYRQRKAQEIERNEAGMFAPQALARLDAAVKAKWRISQLQRDTWASGKLQPIGLDMRAGRYAAKMFLSHFHHVLHEVEEGCPPPIPYALGPLAHADYIAPPGWPCE